MEEKNLVEFIVKALVDNPDDVKIDVIGSGGKTTVLELSVLPEDVGKVIGKNGRIARSIRMILRSFAAKSGKRVELEILD